MKNIIKDKETIEKFKDTLQGVFSITDLEILLNEKHKNQLYRRIKALDDIGLLERFTKGFYVAEGFNLEVLSQKMFEKSYISMGNILAKHLLIGTIPKYRIDAVKVGRSKEFKNKNSTIRYFSLQEELFFGYECIQGIFYANPEKALLDTLYFHQHGASFYFDIYSDIDIECIDVKRINKYLKKYKNKKFKTFVKGYLNDCL